MLLYTALSSIRHLKGMQLCDQFVLINVARENKAISGNSVNTILKSIINTEKTYEPVKKLSVFKVLA